MRVIAGVNISSETFSAVKQLGLLYHLDEVVLVHGANADTMQERNQISPTLMESGHWAVEQCRALLPSDTGAVRAVCEVQDPASLVLDTAAKANADLIVMGTRNLSQLAEVFIGSVSNRVLKHAAMPTLIVKGAARPVTRVLMAIQGSYDATRLQTWLKAHPFKNPVALTIFSAIPPPLAISEHAMVAPESPEDRKRQVQLLLDETGKALAGPQFTVSTSVAVGDPTQTICEAGKNHDLIVVSSHGRKGLSRFLMGSVSAAVVHRAGCSVLVVR